jgi:hypothetical protein
MLLAAAQTSIGLTLPSPTRLLNVLQRLRLTTPVGPGDANGIYCLR